MARIRSIKPEYFDDPDVGQLSAEAALVFVGLWTQADREGRLIDDYRRLKVRLRPFSTCDFNAILAELVDAGFLIRYQSEAGVRLLQVRTFGKHQHCHKDEKASIYPEPTENQKSAGNPPAKTPVSCLLSLGSDHLSLEDCGEAASPPSPPPVLSFAVTGRGAKSWDLTQAYLADLQRDYEHVPVLAECRKASAWLKANPGRTKTAKGMPAFLVGWLNKAAGKGPVGVRPSSLPAPQPGYSSDWYEECQRLHNGACGSQYKHANNMAVAS